ncbi:hypothetical protein MJO29_002943 [Puccinia striiformis f. sp. tritici]|uniref:hypothetical protein n=1 Tax=Puccinia striiformis f. sp. tritici TaxID=168172 RepID=UPI000A126F83|nr:hypothetical protein Pst134EA_005179 [Puccinia striiformis f. sp. tritici]KAH9471272.1 hypothetical protein Pst134EA_005179 [Puccinia striiformis f. sp. tritici]KAI7964845.1 hypothetical protein MJO29_002943 [Puccinia striiformis f. sp. tritici]KAI9619910.1 hypothetical protein H4Q26_013887 [Puccinia striiformis f. sp. tritici PST-130]
MRSFALRLGVALCYFGLASSHHTADDDATLSRSKNGFEESRLVPELLSAFDPQGTLAIDFSDGKVVRHPGVTMTAQETKALPAFQLLPARDGELKPADGFTLMMLDPDSPTHANPSGAKIYLLATGLSLDRLHDPVESYNLVNNTRFLVDWIPPTPEPNTGIHRYTFLLYKGVASKASVQPFQAPTFDRTGFNLTQFTHTAGLQDPYAGGFMNLDSSSTGSQTKQNAQGNSASGRSMDVYTLSTIVVLAFLGAIYLS